MTKRSAFTLIELLLVVGIIATVSSVSIPLYRDYQIRSDLNLATEQATQGLARAKILAQSGKNDDEWGFYVPSGTLYKGPSYEERDQAFDENYPMPSTITTSGLLEVAYSQVEGNPSATGSITLTALNGDQRSILILVQKSGIAMNDSDRITICHHVDSNRHNLTISDNAWPAHQAHGDTLGVCPGMSSASSSSSVSSAPASSAMSSAVSSAASSASSVGCIDRFSVAADGTITTTSTVNITFRAVGSQITYGSGGPEVNVYASYKTGNGNNFTNLFGGNDIDGGESQIVNGVTTGKRLVTKIRGYYKKSGWLTFDKSYTTDDTSGHIIMLRNGDTLPSYPAFGSQQNLRAFLQPYVDEHKKIMIGEYDILLLAELGDIGNPMPASADFQDAVLLLSFAQPAGACN